MTELVLVPGLNTTAEVWRPATRDLSSDVRAHALDCPPLDTVEAVAQALLAQAPDRFHLAGYSFGGYVALAMLTLAPERVEALAMVCTTTTADTPEQSDRRREAIRRTLAGEHDSICRELFPLSVHPDHVTDEALAARFMKLARDYGPDRFVAHQRACIARPDRAAALAAFRGPVLIVSGEQDRIVPLSRQRLMMEAAPEAAVVEVAGAAHLLPLERPGALSAALGRWL